MAAIRQIKHVSVELELSWVIREKTGADALDESAIHLILAEHEMKKQKIKDSLKIPKRFWGRFVFITNLMQQTVSLDGKGRFDVPSIDAPAEDITDFYEFMMTLSEPTISFFQAGLRKFNSVPLATGGTSDPALNDASPETETKTAPMTA